MCCFFIYFPMKLNSLPSAVVDFLRFSNSRSSRSCGAVWTGDTDIRLHCLKVLCPPSLYDRESLRMSFGIITFHLLMRVFNYFLNCELLGVSLIVACTTALLIRTLCPHYIFHEHYLVVFVMPDYRFF